MHMRIEERRRFTRLQAYHCVKYRLLPVDAGPNAAAPLFLPAAIRDISSGGVRLIIEESLPKSALVELKINFPHVANPISCVAKVIWAKQVGAGRRYEVGVEFYRIDNADRDIIGEQIKNVYDKLKARDRLGLLKRLFRKK